MTKGQTKTVKRETDSDKGDRETLTKGETKTVTKGERDSDKRR